MNISNVNGGRSIFKLLIFITLFAEPLLSLHFIVDYTAIIDYSIMSILLIRAYSFKRKNTQLTSLAKYALFALFFIILKSLVIDGLSAVLGQNFGLYIKSFFALVYLFVCYTLFEEKKIVLNFEIWEKFLFWICCCTIVTIVLYRLGLHFVFYRREVMNYPCDQIPFIGLIHYDANAKFRPSWLFYEPSYLGDVLGFNFMMMCKYYLQHANKKKLAIYVLAIIATGSMTGVGCTIGALAFYFVLMKLSFLRRHYIVTKLIAIAFIPTVLTISSVYDITDLVEKGSAIGGTSISTRQSRLVYGLEQVASASTYQIVFGRGKDFNDFGMGVSNCYVQTLCADGAIVLIVFLSIVFLLLKKTNYEYYYMIIAMNAIDLSFLPFIMLMLIIANQYYKRQLYIA